MHLNDGRVVSNFIVRALRNEPIFVYGDGSQTRAFCYVDDLIKGITRLMDTPDEVTGPVNIGNPTEFSMIELAELVLELTGSKSEIAYKALPGDDPTQRQPNIELARSTLDWCPTIELREGLARTIEYFDGLLKAESQD